MILSGKKFGEEGFFFFFNMIPFFQLYKQKKPKQHLIKTKREKKNIQTTCFVG